jgi:hypothetical protein
VGPKQQRKTTAEMQSHGKRSVERSSSKLALTDVRKLRNGSAVLSYGPG